MSDEIVMRVGGEVEKPLALSHADLAKFDEESQIRDVSRIDSRRRGDGIKLSSIIGQAQPRMAATHLTMKSSQDGFTASVPLEAVRDRGLFIYQINGRPLTKEEGGPFRFLISESAACRTDELDDCANVKFVDEIEFTAGKGADSRGA